MAIGAAAGYYLAPKVSSASYAPWAGAGAGALVGWYIAKR